MSFGAAAVTALMSALRSHAQSTGLFADVVAHEPASVPQQGVTCAIWFGAIAPDGAASGLGAVSGTVSFLVQVAASLQQRPLDDVEDRVVSAASGLLAAYSGALTLGGSVRNVDLMRLRAQGGYFDQDSAKFRAVNITLPIVVNDLWAEVA